MKTRVLTLSILLALVGFSCKPPVEITPPLASASPELVALSGASVMIGVGDIAVCGTDGDEKTAHLVDSVLKADSIAKVNDAVFTLGDNAYPDGSASNFALCFAPSWGDSAKRIMKVIHPAPGNHEHQSIGAAPYYQYFGKKAGEPKKGYYSYDVGEWHAIVLNSEIAVSPGFTDADRKAQEDWLRSDLKGSSKPCTLAYWHNPRFSSGVHGSDPTLRPFWQILYDGKADLVLNGHDHHYERFLPQDPAGLTDSTRGIVEFVAGTGGGELYGLRATQPNSAMRIEGYFGVLKLTLGKGEYRSAFIDVSGRVWDQSGGKCHPRTGSAAPTAPTTPAGQ